MSPCLTFSWRVLLFFSLPLSPSGKSTLLKVLSGKHLHPDGKVEVMGRSAFHDTTLNNLRTYMGTDWGRRTVAFSGYGVPLQADIKAKDMMKSVQEMFPERQKMLYKLLQIDPEWRMHQVSDGQRRRVQIMLQMLRPFPVIMMDEITVDLDVITRADFLAFLKAESERGATILFATHIFGGLDDWFTHIMYIDQGRVKRYGRVEEIAEFQARREEGCNAPLLRTVEAWIRADRTEDKPALT